MKDFKELLKDEFSDLLRKYIFCGHKNSPYFVIDPVTEKEKLYTKLDQTQKIMEMAGFSEIQIKGYISQAHAYKKEFLNSIK